MTRRARWCWDGSTVCFVQGIWTLRILIFYKEFKLSYMNTSVVPVSGEEHAEVWSGIRRRRSTVLQTLPARVQMKIRMRPSWGRISDYCRCIWVSFLPLLWSLLLCQGREYHYTRASTRNRVSHDTASTWAPSLSWRLSPSVHSSIWYRYYSNHFFSFNSNQMIPRFNIYSTPGPLACSSGHRLGKDNGIPQKRSKSLSIQRRLKLWRTM